MKKTDLKEQIKARLAEATDKEIFDNVIADRNSWRWDAASDEKDLVDFINAKMREDEDFDEESNEVIEHDYMELLYDEEKERCARLKERATSAIKKADTKVLMEAIARVVYDGNDNVELLNNEDIYLWYIYSGYEDNSLFCTFSEALESELRYRGYYYDEDDEEFYEIKDDVTLTEAEWLVKLVEECEGDFYSVFDDYVVETQDKIENTIEESDGEDAYIEGISLDSKWDNVDVDVIGINKYDDAEDYRNHNDAVIIQLYGTNGYKGPNRQDWKYEYDSETGTFYKD